MPVLYALPEATKLLGAISIWTLRAHVQRGNLRVTRIGRRIFVTSDEIERIRREGLPSLRTRMKDNQAVSAAPQPSVPSLCTGRPST